MCKLPLLHVCISQIVFIFNKNENACIHAKHTCTQAGCTDKKHACPYMNSQSLDFICHTTILWNVLVKPVNNRTRILADTCTAQVNDCLPQQSSEDDSCYGNTARDQSAVNNTALSSVFNVCSCTVTNPRCILTLHSRWQQFLTNNCINSICLHFPVVLACSL